MIDATAPDVVVPHGLPLKVVNSLRPQRGAYLLSLRGEVIYAGSSSNVRVRVRAHRCAKSKANTYAARRGGRLAAKVWYVDDHVDAEQALMDYHEPVLNVLPAREIGVVTKEPDMTGARAHWIVEQAKRAGMTVTEIAEWLGCSRDTVYRWRRDDCRVHGAIALRLEDLLVEVTTGAKGGK